MNKQRPNPSIIKSVELLDDESTEPILRWRVGTAKESTITDLVKSNDFRERFKLFSQNDGCLGICKQIDIVHLRPRVFEVKQIFTGGQLVAGLQKGGELL